MCGIAGQVAGPRGRPEPTTVRRMVEALHHRGPDDSGVETIGRVVLGHARLSIVDVSPAGHQPMRDASGRWWITYNGEAFNHLELRRELGPVAWRGGSDTETLLEALAAGGEDAISRANGLYAYAALDTVRGRLLLVRDRFGIKPLYVAEHQGSLWFASEMQALLAAGIPRRARTDVLEHALEHAWANGRATPIEGIRRVLPGTVVTVDVATLTTAERRWYDPLTTVDPERMAALEQATGEELLGAVEEALRTSVRRRLMADVPVGTMCSGGLDSSLLTRFAADEHPHIQAFNAAIVDQPEFDESAYATAVADALGIELHTVETSAETWRRDFVDVVRCVEYPLTHPSSVPMSQIAKLAHGKGVKVLLSGEGADELFGGYPWLHRVERGDWAARGRALHRLARPPVRALRERGLLPGDRGWFPPGGPSAEVADFEREAVLRARRAYRHHPWARRRLAGALGSLTELYLPHLLNRQDRTTMRWSIETRVPFLDPDVVRLALNLPLERKLEPDRKAPLRDLVRRYVPVVADRPKVGFGMRASEFIEPAARPGFVQDGRLRELLGRAREPWARELAGLDEGRRLLLWSGEVWARTLLDGVSVDSVERDLWR